MFLPILLNETKIKIPTIIKIKPIIAYKSGISPNFIEEIIAIAVIPIPAQIEYVIATGIVFIDNIIK